MKYNLFIWIYFKICFHNIAEVKFLRKSRADWYDPDNWLHRGNLKISTDGNRLLNGDNNNHDHNNHITIPTGNPNVNVPQYTMEAIPHLERVPCQYDSVRFSANSSFNLKVSSNVTITKFFLGDKVIKVKSLSVFLRLPHFFISSFTCYDDLLFQPSNSTFCWLFICSSYIFYFDNFILSYIRLDLHTRLIFCK